MPTRPHRVELLDQRQPGLFRYTSAPTPTRFYQAELHTNANQASSGRASTRTPTRPYQAEPPHQPQPGLIRQSSAPTPTRPHWQSFLTNANQALSGRASTPTFTRPYQAELPTELDKMVDKKYNGNFLLEENFHQLVTVDNQDIFDVKGETERRFSADYTEGIFVNLAF